MSDQASNDIKRLRAQVAQDAETIAGLRAELEKARESWRAMAVLREQTMRHEAEASLAAVRAELDEVRLAFSRLGTIAADRDSAEAELAALRSSSAEEVRGMRAELDELKSALKVAAIEKAEGHTRFKDCGHNAYWTGAFGTCMVCRAEKAESVYNNANAPADTTVYKDVNTSPAAGSKSWFACANCGKAKENHFGAWKYCSATATGTRYYYPLSPAAEENPCEGMDR